MKTGGVFIHVGLGVIAALELSLLFVTNPLPILLLESLIKNTHWITKLGMGTLVTFLMDCLAGVDKRVCGRVLPRKNLPCNNVSVVC